MPHVYRVKLSDPYQMTTISLNDGTEAFKCYVSQQAAYLYEDTILTCTAQTDLSSYNSIDGSITFSLNFSNGDSNYEYELENAKYFKSGPMLIQLGDQMSGVVNFDSATFTENVLHSGRTTGYDSFESYHLGMRCPNGHFLGGTEKINYDNSNHNVNLDCSSVQVHSSNDFNDWWFPQSYNDINADVTCFGNSLWITLDEELDNGEMVWVNALQSLPVGTNTIDHVLQFQYSCLDTIANTTHVTEFSTTREFIVYQGENLATASAENAFIPSTKLISTTTTGWTDTYTSTYSTDSTFTVGTDTQTTPEVIIHVETPSTRLTSTTTTGWTGTYTSTYSTDSTFTVGTDTQTTPEVIIHVETSSAEQTLATVVTSTSTTAWSKPVETDTQRYTSSFSVTINSTSSVFLSTELETSHTPVVSTKSGHTTITTSGTPVSSEKSTTTTDRNLSSSAINSFNNSASNSQTSSPFISSSAPYESSVHLSKSSLRSSLVHTSEQVPSSSIKTKTKVTSGYTTLSTTSRACSSCLDETASPSQNTKIETPIISSMVHYSSAPSSRPSPFNLQVSSMSTSHSFSIYEGKASAFFSSEFSTIFFLVLSYFLY